MGRLDRVRPTALLVVRALDSTLVSRVLVPALLVVLWACALWAAPLGS
jgi:hypothetical protein